MKRYLLDTCVLIWLLEQNKRVKDIAEDIAFFNGDFAVSIETIIEFILLIQRGDLITDITLDELLKGLRDKQISILEYDRFALENLWQLPIYKKHKDATDRLIIAHAIATHRILITGDGKVDMYHNLKHLAV